MCLRVFALSLHVLFGCVCVSCLAQMVALCKMSLWACWGLDYFFFLCVDLEYLSRGGI
jgi:hypothetical protein